ncbi:PLP-dependent aminotransferase family protein [Paenibacillus sp. N1-5-1-14]|uniref:aminotransferase-like domain-containing protein n=1 Tax=Paenibacillus radicibacter TaxID=2972488 RepID=UPI0021592399|nr:PLP-dependent aminotransferase family protein [Paenibacillus radicibacter]MCR8643261.1 PLP-dependent aminotransferase family protein [Paenibacillus radicibacter]
MYKYAVLLNDLETMIQEGRIKDGEKLPSIRDLAEQYACSKSTIIRALADLEKKHLVYVVPKSGYYVVKKGYGSLEDTEPEVINFASASPDWHNFPYVDFQHCINKAIDTYQKDLFVYGTPKGLPSLIKVMHKQLQQYQVFTGLNNIIITSGVQQAISILTQLPFPNGRTQVLVEQPCYHIFMRLVKVLKLPAIGIQRTAQGINLQELERIFATNQIKFFYTMPRFHNPLGTSYSREQKEAIIRLATKYDVYIVEDDHLSDYEQDAKADPIFAYDQNERVIYLKSFSKIIFPGLRVGVAVLPESLVDLFQTYKSITDIDSSMISQAALEIYLKSGMFERHRDKIRLPYIQRSQLLHQTLYPDRPAKSVCMHTHLLLPKHVNVSLLLRRLQEQNVVLESIDRNYLEGTYKEKIVLINVSTVTQAQIEKGLKLVLNEMNHSRNHYM